MAGSKVGSTAVAAWLAALGLWFATGAAHAAQASPAQAAASFRDCRDCPEMVAIPAGSFVMGTDVPLGPAPPPTVSNTNTFDERVHNGPAHPVRITRPFALGRYEVTRGEFARFVAETGYKVAADCNGLGADGEYAPGHATWRNPGFPQTERDPASCINWTDAQAYAAWLSRKTGHKYRLPSDAEWEYAERAGGTTTYWWGDKLEDACTYANLSDLDASARYPGWRGAACHDGHVTSAPVGSFRPNAWGLYDMAGNAWEWVQDCAHDGYTPEAPTDGRAWETPGCPIRLRRGAAFDHGAANSSPAAVRLAQAIGFRKGNTGFRIARDE